MAAVFLSAAVTCFGALFLGQATLRLAGAREWNWLAPAVGLSVAMLVATPTMHVPGRCATMAILLGALSLVAAVWCLRSPAHRPPLTPLLAAVPVIALAAVPFAAAGRGGILGVTVDNDMAVHLLIAESYLSSAVAAVSPLPRDYPLGPHALTALLSEGLGVHTELAFSGWSMATPVITAWTVQAVTRGASWFGRTVAATVVGLPFLVAAYYGQGSFKEVAQAGLVLALALQMSGCGPRLGRGRWVPPALLIGGIVSVFSLPGLPWAAVILGAWVLGMLAIQARRGGLREIPRAVRRELPALGIGLVVGAIFLLPQAHRMLSFVELRNGSGIAANNLGNLVGPLSGWEAFGVWRGTDFRIPAASPFDAWTAFVLALALFGVYWAFRRGRWLLPLAAAGAMAIWAVSQRSQSPYVVAKALVVASPLLLLLAVLPLVDRDPAPRAPWRSWRSWPWLLAPLLGLVLLLRVGSDSLRALRFSPVGPTDHARQLESFRSSLAGKPTLFLGNEVFIGWELAGVPVQTAALANLPEVPLRPQKEWQIGQALDFDSVRASTLNEFEWIVSPHDAASSAAPSQLRLVRSTPDYLLWKRVGRIPERSILREGEWPGAVLRCRGADALGSRRGVAATRRLPIVAPVPAARAGETVSVTTRLPVGRWELETPYTSPYPVQVTAPGLHTVLPANLDLEGPRLPIGRLTVRAPGKQRIAFHVEDTALSPPTAGAAFGQLVATPAGGHDRVVPISRACGAYVDWYRLAAG